MEDAIEIQEAINEVKAAFLSGSEDIQAIQEKLQIIKKHRPYQGLNLFEEFLNSSSPIWRSCGIESLRHYKSHAHIVEKIGTFLREKLEPDIGVRSQAADYLSQVIEEPNEPIQPDFYLKESLRDEENFSVKCHVFRAFIRRKTDEFTADDAFIKITENQLRPTREDAEKVVTEWKSQNSCA
jgi:hypothetical protein